MATRPTLDYEVSRFLSRRFEPIVPSMSVEIIEKEDLDLLNHLSGLKGKFIRLSFDHVDELQRVLKPIREAVNRNQKLKDRSDNTVYC